MDRARAKPKRAVTFFGGIPALRIQGTAEALHPRQELRHVPDVPGAGRHSQGRVIQGPKRMCPSPSHGSRASAVRASVTGAVAGRGLRARPTRRRASVARRPRLGAQPKRTAAWPCTRRRSPAPPWTRSSSFLREGPRGAVVAGVGAARCRPCRAEGAVAAGAGARARGVRSCTGASSAAASRYSASTRGRQAAWLLLKRLRRAVAPGSTSSPNVPESAISGRTLDQLLDDSRDAQPARELAVEAERDVVGNLSAGQLAEVGRVEHEQEGVAGARRRGRPRAARPRPRPRRRGAATNTGSPG